MTVINRLGAECARKLAVRGVVAGEGFGVEVELGLAKRVERRLDRAEKSRACRRTLYLGKDEMRIINHVKFQCDGHQ